MPKLPNCILFDLDGTLLDSIPGITYSVNAALRAAGLPERSFDLRPLIGPPIRTILSRVAATENPALLDTLEQHFRESYDTEGWRQTICFPGATEILRAMKTAGHRLFVVSNKPGHISRRILDSLELSPCFEQIYNRDSRQPPYRSKEDMLYALLVDHRLAPGDCVLAGDTMEDAAAAALYKVAFIFMEHGYGELPRAQPVLLRLKNFSDFLPYLALENVP